MLRLLIAFLIAYMGLVATMTVRQRSFMYFPLTTARPDITKAPWMSWVDTTTKDGLDLKSWFSEPQDGMPTLIFFHGNGHNIESRGPKILPFVDKGYGVLLAEYRGYGGNPGNPSEKGFYHDARAQIDWLADKHGIKGDDLIMYGESIGSGVAVQMVGLHEIGQAHSACLLSGNPTPGILRARPPSRSRSVPPGRRRGCHIDPTPGSR